MSTIQDKLNGLMPSIFDTNSNAYKLLISDSDNDGGAIAQALAELMEFRDYYTKTISVDDASDILLDKIVTRFSGLMRNYAEPDDYFRLRYKALVDRHGYGPRATSVALRKSYSYFFDDDNIFIIENYPTSNIILNGSFDTLDDWIVSGNADANIIYSKSFENGSALQLIPANSLGQGTIYQDVVASTVFHSLVFFFSSTKRGVGALGLSIKNLSNGKYWDPTARVWTTTAKVINYSVDDITAGKYTMEQLFLPVDAGTIRISFSTVSAAGFLLDAVAFGPIEYPNIRAVLVADPEVFHNSSVKYDNTISHNGFYKYYILWGLDEIMNKTRAAGVKGTTHLLSDRLNIPWDRTVKQISSTFDITPIKHDSQQKYNSAIIAVAVLQAVYDGARLHDGTLMFDGKYETITRELAPSGYTYGYRDLRTKHIYKKRVEQSVADILHNSKVQYNSNITHSEQHYGASVGMHRIKISKYMNETILLWAAHDGARLHDGTLLFDGAYTANSRQLVTYYI